MKIYYHPTKENSLFPNQLFDGNKELSHILTKDVDVILWEYNDSITDWQAYRQAQDYHASVALLIADYEKFRDDAHIQFYLRNANCVVVPTIAAKRDLILNSGFGGEKIFTDEFRDLPLSWHVDTDNRYSKEIQTISDIMHPVDVFIQKLHHGGGWGLLTNRSQFNVDEGLSYFLAARLPIIAFRNSATAQLVSKYHLGKIIDNGDDPSEVIRHIDKQQYDQITKNVSKVSTKITKLYFSRQMFNEACYHVIIRPKLFINYSSIYRPAQFDLKVMNSSDTASFIANNQCSVARFGDGEIALINGVNQVFQDADSSLRQRLNEIVKQGSNSKLLVCLSDVFHNIKVLTPQAQDWWLGHIQSFRSYYREIAKRGNVYGNTMVTRPYIDFIDRSHAGDTFNAIRQWWNNRDLLIVEGYYTRSGVGNDLYSNAHSVKRIICPSKNAWSEYRTIEQLIKRYGQGRLVLVMLGMTATVIAADLSNWGQVIDLGHLDSEYEWYKMGVTERVPITGKHTAEMNYDRNISDLRNQEYEKQIIVNISGRK